MSTLSEAAIRAAKPTDKVVKLLDGDGLLLRVAPTGSKVWRLRYRFDGKENMLSLGSYPAVSLKEARVRRNEARVQLARGIDPAHKRREQRNKKAPGGATDSFEAVAREWLAKQIPTWAPAHAERIVRLFERDIFPWIGRSAIRSVTATQLLALLRRIEDRGAVDTTHRARATCGQVFRYAVSSGRAERDPSVDLRGAIGPVKPGHFAAATEPAKVAELLRKIYGYQGGFVVASALKLAPLVFVRPAELRTAEWAHINLEIAEWRFRVSKTDVDHIVPLSTQAVAILRDLHRLTGTGRYVFPSERGPQRPMSDNACLAAMRTMGITKEEHSGHGWRATARTLLDEALQVRPELIEHQLAHAVRDPLGRAYNRTKHLPERREMMQRWADYLDGLRGGTL